jgi:aryl-alcohol dehydrogenase-like predicted oxidoreductase
MARFCSDHPMTLLAYGTLLGGLSSEKYLGRREPRRSELNTASLQKYKNMLDLGGTGRCSRSYLRRCNKSPTNTG